MVGSPTHLQLTQLWSFVWKLPFAKCSHLHLQKGSRSGMQLAAATGWGSNMIKHVTAWASNNCCEIQEVGTGDHTRACSSSGADASPSSSSSPIRYFFCKLVQAGSDELQQLHAPQEAPKVLTWLGYRWPHPGWQLSAAALTARQGSWTWFGVLNGFHQQDIIL